MFLPYSSFLKMQIFHNSSLLLRNILLITRRYNLSHLNYPPWRRNVPPAVTFPLATPPARQQEQLDLVKWHGAICLPAECLHAARRVLSTIFSLINRSACSASLSSQMAKTCWTSPLFNRIITSVLSYMGTSRVRSAPGLIITLPGACKLVYY
jgi:hypothetical protein